MDMRLYAAFVPSDSKLSKREEELLHFYSAEGTKQCSRCGVTLPVSLYSKHDKAEDGLQSYCRICNRDNMRIWQQKKELEDARREIDDRIASLVSPPTVEGKEYFDDTNTSNTEQPGGQGSTI